MGAVRIAILATAAVAAIALAFLVRGMMNTEKPDSAPVVAAAAAPRPMARVLVAKKDLAVGARIDPIDLGWQEWPMESLHPTFVTDGSEPRKVTPQEGVKKVAHEATQAAQDLVASDDGMKVFDGAIVKEPILAGEPITARKVVRGGEGGFMAVVLSPGMRAVAIPVTAESGAGGFILPGDRVDILQARAQEGGGKGSIVETLMQNVRILAIDQRTEPEKEARTIVGGVATVEVSVNDVEVLARGRAQGEMMLSLRPYSDIAGPARRGSAPTAASSTVRIVRAGDISEVAVK
ncbi:MAG: Flp pilus assembly protein CpaB [Phenylobacterium sp.]